MPHSQFRNLVFEGGGIKGIAYAGAIRILEDKKILADIQRFGGASAGAITAALLAAGATSRDVEEIVGHTSFRAFMDDSFGVLRDISRLVHDYGWFKGDAFSQWLRNQFQTLVGDPDIEFAKLREKTKKDLYVVGTDLSLQRESVFSPDQTPDVSVWQAVRISMSIPLFFACVRQNDDVCVDGGVTWNYPIDLFDDELFDPAPGAFERVNYPTVYGNSQIYNKETLGFRVDTKDEIAAEMDHWKEVPRPIHDIADYAAALVGFMQDLACKRHLHDNDWHRTVFIDDHGIRTTQFDLSDEQVKQLVQNGIVGTNDYFKWFDDPAAKTPPKNRAKKV